MKIAYDFDFDAVILRDADDPEDSWIDPSDGVLETRHYYCQYWRADVAVVIHDSATSSSA